MREEEDDRQNISRDGKKKAEERNTLSSYKTPASPYLLGSPTFPLEGRTDLPRWTGSGDLDKEKKGKGGEKENMYPKVRTSRDKFYEQKLEKEEKAEIEDQLKEIRRKRREKQKLAASGDEEDEETERKMEELKEDIDSLDTATDESEEELRKMRLNPTPKKSSGSSDYRLYKTDPQGQVYVEYKPNLDGALKKAQLTQLEKANKSTGGPDLVVMNTPIPAALPSGPGAAPQPFVPVPPQAYGNPQPFHPPTPPMGPVQCWGCGQFGHKRNRCPQGPQYTRARNPQPGFRRRLGGNYRGGNRGRYQGQGRSWKNTKDHGRHFVNQAGDLKIEIENDCTRIPCTPEIIEYSPQQRQDEDDLSSVPDYLWSNPQNTMADSTEYREVPSDRTPMKPDTPLAYLQDKYPFLKKDLVWVFEKWYKWTEKEEKYRYPEIGSFDKEKCRVVTEMVKDRQANKKKDQGKDTELYVTILGLLTTEGQTFDALSQLRYLKGFPMIGDVSRLTNHVYGVDSDFGFWIDGLKRKWMKELGERHDNTFETEEMFYDKACENLPDKVQAKLKDIVGWHRMDGPTKEGHLHNFCRIWSNEKTEEKTQKSDLDGALKKAQLTQLEKSNKSTGGPDLVVMNTPIPAALPSGPAAAPQSFVPVPPQACGNPQPFHPPTPPMGPVQCWGRGQFGHKRNRCPQGPQYTRARNPHPGFRRRRWGNYRGGNRGRYQGQGRSWKNAKDHGGHFVNQAVDLKIDIENDCTRIPCTPEIIEYSPQQRQDEDDLSSVPDYLWSKGGHDIGLIKSAEPVLVRLKPGYEGPRQKQNPMSPEGEQGIGATIGELNQGQVIYPTISLYNTPILPVKKPTGKYKMVQDFRQLNKMVDSEFPLVPDPSVILSSVPPEASTFSFIELRGAFLSVPLHPDCHNLFSFSYKGTQYTYSRLPRGFCESPSIFNRVLQNDLRDMAFPEGSTLVRHVDDLLICSTTPEICKIDTLHLLKELAVRGHKVSKEKLQLWKPKVLFIGLEMSQHQKTLSKERIKTILNTPRPVNIKGLMSFLGCTGHCRNWICDYSVIASPLREMCNGRPSEELVWNTDQAKAFEDLKRALANAPALGVPDFKEHFYIHVAERGGFASAVVTQKVSNEHKPCAYYSTRLDNVVRGMHPCDRSLAATAYAIEKSASLILTHNATVYVSYVVLALLNQKNSCLTAARLAGYETLLTKPNLTIERCATVNPADLLAARQEGTPHCCK